MVWQISQLYIRQLWEFLVQESEISRVHFESHSVASGFGNVFFNFFNLDEVSTRYLLDEFYRNQLHFKPIQYGHFRYIRQPSICEGAPFVETLQQVVNLLDIKMIRSSTIPNLDTSLCIKVLYFTIFSLAAADFLVQCHKDVLIWVLMVLFGIFIIMLNIFVLLLTGLHYFFDDIDLFEDLREVSIRHCFENLR